jgi:hypothetical protein
MTIAGIDLSTKAVDVVLLDEDTDAATWHRFPLEGQDAFARARAVKYAMPNGSFWDEVVAIGIEDPRGYGAGSIYRVQGAILGELPGRTLVHPMVPSSWRKTVGLAGNASKAAVKEFVPTRAWNVDWPQDACDAYLIALATRMMIERTEAA